MLDRTAYYGIPEGTYDSLRRYVQWGVPLGGFLAALVSNDLMGAANRADDRHVLCFHELARFVFNEMPVGCQGSRPAVRAWIEMGGLEGERNRGGRE